MKNSADILRIVVVTWFVIRGILKETVVKKLFKPPQTRHLFMNAIQIFMILIQKSNN